MMRLAAMTMCVLAASTTAFAEAKFYNATSGTLTVEAKFPNGMVEKQRLNDGSNGASSIYFLTPPGVDKLDVRIYDDIGTELWKGSAGKNDTFVTIPDGKGTKTVYSGLYSGGFDTPKAALVMNLTGDALTIDLEGMNGVGSHRGIKPAGFDPKQLVRLDPKESYFTVMAKGGPKGEVEIKSAKLQPGHYYLITKHPSDTYRLLMLGYITPPPSAKK